MTDSYFRHFNCLITKQGGEKENTTKKCEVNGSENDIHLVPELFLFLQIYSEHFWIPADMGGGVAYCSRCHSAV